MQRFSLRYVRGVSVIYLCISLVICSMAFVVGDEEESPLHEAMEHIGKAFKQLSREVRKASRADQQVCLKLLTTMEEELLKAKLETPHKLEKLNGDEKQKKLSAFRADILRALEAVIRVEQAVIKKEWKKAERGVRELNKLQRRGHEEYKE